MTLRRRLLIALAPTLVLLALLGGAGVVLFSQIGNRINAILRENYDSIEAMAGLLEAVDGLDASFTLPLLGQEQGAKDAYERHWAAYNKWLAIEKANITIVPPEAELCEQLEKLSGEYRSAGDDFHRPGQSREARRALYLGTPGHKGLRQQAQDVREVANAIRVLNEDNMKAVSQEARRTAKVSVYGFTASLALTLLLALGLIWHTARTILGPLRSLTRSVQQIGAGNLNQTVPVLAHDALGALADAFNRMTRQLRDYRQTHLSRLLRTQRTSQATIDSFPDAVLVIDTAGRVEMANPAARRLLGIAPASKAGEVTDLEGLPPAVDWQPPEGLVRPLHDALQHQRPFLTQAFDQTIAFQQDKEERAFLPQVLPIQGPFGDALGTAVVLNDVTRFRLLDQIKSDLVATVSHELKTPLTSVRLVLHLLLEETVGPLTPKQTELVVDARDNAERLLQMIEHLLALARLEQGEALQVRPEAAEALLQTAADAARPRAEGKHIDLVIEAGPDLPLIAVDAARLGAALNNLLDNAITYTGEGGRITLSAVRGRDDRGTVELAVSDTGKGIPPEHLPHVFERFFRVPGQSQGQGTGLGLAIVREIVASHHGSVRCDSRQGRDDRGTTFTLTLPVWSQHKPSGVSSP